MADKKISDLTSGSAIGGTEELPIVQSGSTVKTTISAIKTYFDTIYATISGYVKKGTLTTNYIPKATASDTIGDSALYENGSGFGVNYGGQDVFYGDATESFMGLSTNEFIDVIAARIEIKHSVEIKLNAPVVNATNLTASQRVETDSNKNFVSVAKGTADNKDFGTGTANIVEIGSTLGNSKPLITSSSGKLQTSDWVDITSSCTYVGWSSYTNQEVEYLDMGSYYLIRLSVSGTSNNTITTIQIPFTINYGFNSVNIFTNNGSSLGGRVVISAASDTFIFSSSVTGGTWTAAGTKTINCTLTIKK